MRILVIEDDPEIRSCLETSLQSENFAVDSTESGEIGSYMARVNEYDIVLLDYILPKKNGLEVCSEIRAAGKKMPILLLSVKNEVHDKVTLLDAGVDDYVTKPFSFNELMARIRALFRRPRDMETDVLSVGDLKLDRSKHKVSRGKREIYLTRKEFSLLECLMRHKGIVLTRGIIMEHVWNAESDPFSNTIEAHILNLRKKIEGARGRRLIFNVPGRGYKIDDKK